MARRALGTLLIAFLAGLGAPRLSAQAGKLAEITLTGSKKYDPALVIAASGLKAGEIVDRGQIQAAADRLAQLGPFEKVNYRFASRGEDISLEFQLEDAPSVPVSFDNFPWFTDAELAEALRQAVNLFDGTAPQQGTILDALTTALNQYLAAHGIQGTVERTLIARPVGEGSIQQFKVVGASLSIQAVEFTDKMAADSPRIHDRLPDIVGKPYSRYTVELFENEQVRPLYLSAGYLQVRIEQPRARFTGDPNRPLPSSVLVIIPIETGPVYRWGGAEWRGNSTLSAQALDAAIGLNAGEIADGMKITGGWDRAQAEYAHIGFLDAKLDPQPAFNDAAQRVSYRVTVVEGPQYRMGQLILTGLSLDAEKKMRDAWRIAPGQVFDRNYFDQLLPKLQKGSPEIFGGLPVHFQEVGHWLREHPETGTVDVLLDFK